MESLLGIRHVSALALGHLQVSTFVSEETIQCDYSNRLTFIQRDLVDMENITKCQAVLVITKTPPLLLLCFDFATCILILHSNTTGMSQLKIGWGVWHL
jgi:hypothetical protein